MKKIKEAGKGDTNSHEKIPEASEQKIIELLVTLQAIMEIKEKNSEEYQALVEKLPTVYRDTYHKLIQKGMQFIFMSLLAKQGREGIDKVEKNDFKKCYDEDGDYYFWTRVIIRRTKNHQ